MTLFKLPLAHKLLLYLPIALISQEGIAQDYIAPEDAIAELSNQTFLFSLKGQAPYGMETYLSGNRVIWTFLDGECISGVWAIEETDICYTYQGDPTPKCWQFLQLDEGLGAVFKNDPNSTEIFLLEPVPNAMVCADLSS